MLDMIETTSQNDRARIEKIEKLMNMMGEQIREQIPKAYSKDLLEIIFRLPYTKRNFLVKAGLGNSKTSGNYLKSLEAKGFLKSITIDKEKLYLNFKMRDLLLNK